MSLDAQAVLVVQRVFLSSSWTIELAVVCAQWLLFANVLLAVWLLWSGKARERHAVLEAAWSVGLALLLTFLLALCIQRVRPYLTLPDVTLLIPQPHKTAFPSGHTSSAVAIASAFWIGNRRVGFLAIALASLVALGRIAVGVHYATDLLGGALVGIASVAIVRMIHRALRRRDIEASAQTHHHDA